MDEPSGSERNRVYDITTGTTTLVYDITTGTTTLVYDVTTGTTTLVYHITTGTTTLQMKEPFYTFKPNYQIIDTYY